VAGKVEEDEERKIAHFSKEKERMSKLRKQKEHEKHTEDQKRRQKMIDRAVKDLAMMQKDEGARLHNQAAEVREKQDREEFVKTDRRRRQQEAIDRSRQMQLEMKRRNREARVKKDADQAREARRWNAKLGQEEGQAVVALRRRDEAHQDFLFGQIQEKAITKGRDESAELIETVGALGSYKEEESTFCCW
jgi:hypothetical protein